MKIENKRFSQLPEHFQVYLSFLPVSYIRWVAIVITIMFVDAFIIEPISGNPFIPLYLYIVILPVIFINIWALRMCIKPYNRQLEFVLFYGVLSFIISLGYIVVSFKFVYGMFQFDSISYAIGLGYIAANFLFSILNDLGMAFIMNIWYLSFSGLFAYGGVMYLHKYFFMKKTFTWSDSRNR